MNSLETERKILVSVKNKIAETQNDPEYICGNSDYDILFDFDDEWAEYDVKTARFKYNGTFQDQVFSGNECQVPVISNTSYFEVGVYAGDLHTTTPAYVSARKSILCGSGVPEKPRDDVYAQIMEKINSLTADVSPEQIEQAVNEYMSSHPIDGVTKEELEQAVADALTKAKESGQFNGKDGKNGISVIHAWNGTTLTVTSASGTSSADLKGEKGEPGVDGKDGVQGPAGADGKDGTSVTHSWNGTTLTVTSASGTSSADLKGEKGEPGVDGKDGVQGPAGPAGADGKDYVLTEADKQEIAGMVEVTGGSGTSIDDTTPSANTTYSSQKIESELNALNQAIDNKVGTDELNTAVEDALTAAKESGQFDGAPGAKGDPGDDYVLTEADKEEIAEMAAKLVEVPEGGGGSGSGGATKLVKILEYTADANAPSAASVDFTATEYPNIAKIVGTIVVHCVFATAPTKWVNLGVNGSFAIKLIQKTNFLGVAGKTGDYYFGGTVDMSSNPNTTYGISAKTIRFSPSDASPLFSQGAKVSGAISKINVYSWSSGWIASGDKITIWGEVTE